jgi:hypothetical protein
VPKDEQGMHEITKEKDDSYNEFKDYEVFSISAL